MKSYQQFRDQSFSAFRDWTGNAPSKWLEGQTWTTSISTALSGCFRAGFRAPFLLGFPQQQGKGWDERVIAFSGSVLMAAPKDQLRADGSALCSVNAGWLPRQLSGQIALICVIASLGPGTSIASASLLARVHPAKRCEMIKLSFFFFLRCQRLHAGTLRLWQMSHVCPGCLGQITFLC